MNKETIIDALKFYHIKNKNYQLKCLECIDFLKENRQLKAKVLEIRKKMLEDDFYLKSPQNYQDLKNILKENTPSFLTNIILLSCYKKLDNNPRNLPKNQIKKIKNRIKETLINDIYVRKYNTIRISQLLWGIRLTKSNILEIGRLQYELSYLNPLTLEKEKVIKIHISKGKKLNIKAVKQSLKKAPQKIKKYFNLDHPNYYCVSWLLSKEILNVLEKNSNIMKFSKMFAITDGDDCTSDILNFVFEITESQDYHDLPEKTSLQKEIKKVLLNGNIFHLGIGLLKK